MDSYTSSKRGNNPDGWNKLLNELDEKMQLGLLDRLKRVKSYHFELETLSLQPDGEDDFNYLSKPAVLQQLELFVDDVCKINKIKLVSE